MYEYARNQNIDNEVVETMYVLLHETSAERFAQLQFKAAMRLKDEPLMIHRTIAMKGFELGNVGRAHKWEMRACPLLREP